MFFKYLENLPWFWGAITLMLAFIAFTTFGILIIRRTFDKKTLKSHHDVAGVVFTNVGVLYSVLLGFTVLHVQERFDKFKEHAEYEAGLISQLYQDAEVFPEGDKMAIRFAIKTYTESIISEEWNGSSKAKNAMSKMNQPNQQGEKKLQNIWKIFYGMTPSDKKQEIWYTESVGKLNQLTSARLYRLLEGVESLGAEIWALLILGGVTIITFTWFFSVDHLPYHILMAAILAASTAFFLFLIYSLDTSLSGDLRVSPEAFIRVLDSVNYSSLK